MTNKKNVVPAVSDITLNDEMLHYGQVQETKSWYENHFYLVMGEMKAHDFLLIASVYVLKGPPGGYCIVEDGIAHQTTFFMLPQEKRGMMMDNDYIQGGFNPQEYLKGSELKISRLSDRVVWKVQDREYISYPPYWELHGAHKGVGLELTMRGIRPTISYAGILKDLAQHGRAGMDQYVQAEGTITVGRKKYEISRAGGYHERTALVDVDQVGDNKGAYHWMVGWDDHLQIFLFHSPGWEHFMGRVDLDGKVIGYEGREQVTLNEVAFWEDPQSHCMIASKWHLNLRSSEGVLDVTIAAGGRAFYLYSWMNGYLARYWTLGFANGSFLFPDGRTVAIKDLKVATDRSWALMVIK